MDEWITCWRYYYLIWALGVWDLGVLENWGSFVLVLVIFEYYPLIQRFSVCRRGDGIHP